MGACQKYIVDTKKDPVAGHNCFLASLGCIIEHYGCRYSEMQLFLISNGFRIRYGNDLNEIGRYTMEGLNEFGKRTLIQVTIQRRDIEGFDPEKIVQVLENSMIMLDVDTKHLSYNRLYLENDNRRHLIVLYGIDTIEKSVNIMDLYMLDYMGNITAYCGKIPFDEMTAAAFRYFYFCFDNKKDLSESEILRYACTDFRIFMEGSQDNEGAIGSLALRNYLRDILKLEALDNDELACTCANINYNIKIRSFNLINKYLICFLDENAAIKRRDNEEMLGRISWHMTEWEKVGLAILRIGISKRKSSLVSVYEKSMQLFDSQMKVYELFSCLLDEAAVSG